MRQPKILFFDIETAPILGDVWGLWKNNVGLNQIRRDWFMLSWAAKWAHEDEIMSDSLPEHPAYLDDKVDDLFICFSLWELLDEADIVVGHNGNKFDIPKVNARFIKHGLGPTSPYRKVDTLLEARKNFRFTSNKLEHLGDFLKVGKKMKHQGHDLWTGCIQGDMDAWETMVKYNRQDIVVLEGVYYKLLPWMQNHPNLGLYVDEEDTVCPKCGGKHIQWRGYAYTAAGRYHRFRCNSCGGWGRGTLMALAKTKRKALVRNVV